MPVSWPFFVIRPKTLPVSAASMLYCSMILSTFPIELFKSVPLMFANSINCFESPFRVSPVAPNLVLISPAVPASAISIGISVKRSSATAFSSSNASPVAPVFVIMVS